MERRNAVSLNLALKSFYKMMSYKPLYVVIEVNSEGHIHICEVKAGTIKNPVIEKEETIIGTR